MTLEEKLENFYISVIDSATDQSVAIIDEYKNSLQKIYNDREQAAIRKANNNYRIETENLVREKNRRLSGVILELKGSILNKTSKLTDRIFDEVVNKLTAYMKSSSYVEFLIRKIDEAVKFARGEEIVVYINASDKHLMDILENATGIKLTISDRDFTGGIRAVIPSRKILIDYSFITKLAEEKSSFKLSI